MAEETSVQGTQSEQAAEATPAVETVAENPALEQEQQPPSFSDTDYIKMKAAADKANKEAAEYKRKYNAKLTEDERRAAEETARQAAIEEELASLKKQAAVSEFAKRAIGFGMDEHLANDFAGGLYGASDVESVYASLDRFKLGLEKSIEIKLLQTNPRPANGSQDVPEVTRDQFLAMNYTQRTELYAKDPELYMKLNGGK